MFRGARGLFVGSLFIGSLSSVLSSATAVVHAQEAPLTIDQAVREALDHNPTLAAERYNVNVADAAIKTARLRPNPVLTVSALRPEGTLNTTGVQPNEQVVRTDVILESPGKRARRIEQASLAKGVTELQLQDTRRQLVLDVQQAFVDIQVAKLDLTLAQENLRGFEDVVQVNTERVRAGDLAPVELERSRLAALQFQNDLRQQETKLRVAKSALATLLGRDPKAAADTLDVAGDIRKDDQPIDRETLNRLAHDQRPDLQAAKRDQARSEADIRLQLANGRIDYTISGEYHRQEQDTPNVKGNAYLGAISVPLPFFNRNQGEIARARAEHDQIGQRITALDASVTNEVTTAFAEYTTARESLATIESQMLTRARDVRTTTEYAYRRGEASFVEFLDAVRAFNETMQGYNDARADYARSLYALDAISGKVIP